MELSEFCQRLSRLKPFSNAQKAVSILWFHDQDTPGIKMAAPELSKIMRDNSIGNPTDIAGFIKQIQKTQCVYKHGKSFSIKESGKPIVQEWVQGVLNGENQSQVIDIGAQIFPDTVWKNTRGYIERVALQINVCYREGCYDACAVLIRRVTETLIIECYEHLGRTDEIKGTDDNYFMLSGLVTKAVDSKSGLSIGRDSKAALRAIKETGDRSAHNRKYNARKIDIDNIKDGFRLSAEELINTANLYSTK